MKAKYKKFLGGNMGKWSFDDIFMSIALYGGIALFAVFFIALVSIVVKFAICFTCN